MSKRQGATPPVDAVFAALASPTRLELLRLLRDEGSQPVQQLADHFAMRRPSVSEHLRLLREVGLVREVKQGRQRLYSLEAAPLRIVHAWLTRYEEFWKTRIARLDALLAEDEHDDERHK